MKDEGKKPDQYDLDAARLVVDLLTAEMHGQDRPEQIEACIAAALRQSAQAERKRCLGVVDWFIAAADRGLRTSPDSEAHRVIRYHREAYEMVRDGIIDAAGRALTTPPAPEEGQDHE